MAHKAFGWIGVEDAKSQIINTEGLRATREKARAAGVDTGIQLPNAAAGAMGTQFEVDRELTVLLRKTAEASERLVKLTEQQNKLMEDDARAPAGPRVPRAPRPPPRVSREDQDDSHTAATSNINGVVVNLRGIIAGFDLSRTGRDQSLGRDRANKLVECIHERIDRHVAPDGTPWRPNSDKPPPPGGYRKWKEDKYGLIDEPNIRTGQMTSQKSLYGHTTIEPYLITMVYGTDTPPDRSAAPTGYMSKEDKKTTDTEKAYYAHTGQSRKRIKRSFYAATAGDTPKLGGGTPRKTSTSTSEVIR